MDTILRSFDLSNCRCTPLVQAAAALLLALGLAGSATTASAQASSAAVEAQTLWQNNFDTQVAQELRQRPSQRVSFLQVVTEQARTNDDLHLPETTDALLDIIETDANRRHRLMAVQALSKIGPEHLGEETYRQAMSRLYTLAEKDASKQVKSAIAEAINRAQTG